MLARSALRRSGREQDRHLGWVATARASRPSAVSSGTGFVGHALGERDVARRRRPRSSRAAARAAARGCRARNAGSGGRQIGDRPIGALGGRLAGGDEPPQRAQNLHVDEVRRVQREPMVGEMLADDRRPRAGRGSSSVSALASTTSISAGRARRRSARRRAARRRTRGSDPRQHLLGDGLSARRGRSLRIRSDSVRPSRAARAFSDRWSSSGTLRIWIIFMCCSMFACDGMHSRACTDSAAELLDHLVEHRQRRPPLDPRARGAKRLRVEQADLAARAKAALSSSAVMTSARSISVRDGDVTGMPSTVVTSSGCSGGPRWTSTPGIETAVRGSSAESGT